MRAVNTVRLLDAPSFFANSYIRIPHSHANFRKSDTQTPYFVIINTKSDVYDYMPDIFSVQNWVKIVRRYSANT